MEAEVEDIEKQGAHVLSKKQSSGVVSEIERCVEVKASKRDVGAIYIGG